MGTLKLFLILSVILSLTLALVIPLDAEAAKAKGTSSSRIGVDKICGDKICDYVMDDDEKLVYYMLNFLEIPEDTVIQQSRFMMGGVAQQEFGAGGIGKFDTEMKLNRLPGNSLMDKGIRNSLVVPIVPSPTIDSKSFSGVGINGPNIGGKELAVTSPQSFQNNFDNKMKMKNLGNMNPEKFVKMINDKNRLPEKIDSEQISNKMKNPDNGKTIVCHKDKKSLFVNDSSLQFHLKHGDYTGECKSKSDNPSDDPHNPSENRITLCHVSSDHLIIPKTITVSEKQSKRHLKHGDYLGMCSEIHLDVPDTPPVLGIPADDTPPVLGAPADDTKLIKCPSANESYSAIWTQEKILIHIQELQSCSGKIPMNQDIFPKNVGKFNGWPIVEQFFCSDVCPDAGAVYLIFEDLPKEQCSAMGGDVKIDFAWGAYRGCQPNEPRVTIYENDIPTSEEDPLSPVDEGANESENKVTICHAKGPRNGIIPLDPIKDFETITILKSELKKHTAHGDSTGSCFSSPILLNPSIPVGTSPEIPAPEIPAPEIPAPEIPAPEIPAPEIPAPEVEQLDSTNNLVTNGSFETPIVTKSGGWNIYSSGTPDLHWTVASASDDSQCTVGLELQRQILGGPDEGSQHAELDTNCSVSISQTIETVSGNTYDLSFASKARPNTASDTNGLEVNINGNIINDISKMSSDWTTSTHTFVSTGPTKIEFVDTAKSDSFGTFLDDVVLVETKSELLFQLNGGIHTINDDGTGHQVVLSRDNSDWSEEKPFPRTSSFATFPNFSSDHKKILFVKEKTDSVKIECIPDPYDGSVAELCYDSTRYSSLFIMNADGTDEKQLFPYVENLHIHYPEFSPDGSKISFNTSGNVPLGTITDSAPLGKDLFLMNSDGTDISHFQLSGNQVHPKFTSNGDKILYLEESSGKSYFINLDGTELTLSHQGYPTWIDFSSDGEMIVGLKRGDDKQLHHSIMNSAMTQEIAYVDVGFHQIYAEFSPDNKKILFGGGDRDDSLWVANVDGSDARIIPNTIGAKHPDW